MTTIARRPGAALPPGVRAAIHPHRRPLAAGAGLAAVAPLLALAEPWPLAIAVDHAIDHRPFTGVLAGVTPPSPGVLLIVCSAATLAIAALAGGLDYLMVARTQATAEAVGADLRQAVFDRAMTLTPRFHDRTPSGELVSRLTTDVGRVLDALTAATMVVLADGITVIAALAVLVAVDPPLALVALVAVPALAMVAARQRRKVRGAQRAARAEAGRLAAVATDLLRHVRAVQSLSRRRTVERRFDHANTAVLGAQRAAARIEAGWTPRADLVLAAGTAVALVVGAARVLDGRISTGALLLVLAYVRELYRPVRSLARLGGTFAKAGASAERLEEVLACDERVPDPIRPQALPPLRHGIDLTAVRFDHGTDLPVLDGLDLRLPAGALTVLTGPSGAGKSSLLHLLLRLYDVGDGAIRLDGVDVRDVALAGLRERIAYVPQEPWLVDGTIAENIALGRVGVTRAEIEQAARAVGVMGFARTRPRGLDAPVGEGGRLLSGGQQRRVAIARAVVSGAELMLVDEPTVALDPVARAEVLAALTAAVAGRTAVVVTHDPAVVALADHVVELATATTKTRTDTAEEVNHDQEHRPDRRPVPPGTRPHPHAHPDPQPGLSTTSTDTHTLTRS